VVAVLFSNLPMAVALTIAWPLVLLGVLAACGWLERRTLVDEELVPGRRRRLDDELPEVIEAKLLEGTARVAAAYWSATGRRLPARPPAAAVPMADGQLAARRAASADGDGAARPLRAERNGRHARRRLPSAGRGRHERH
jgi:hypothetical protein